MKHPLCVQTVTLYRLAGDEVLRIPVENAFYSWQDCLAEGEDGIRFQRKCFLVTPVEILPGDRVLEGVGPEIEKSEWTAFLPVNIPTLSEVAYAEPKYFFGKLHHYEGGRK